MDPLKARSPWRWFTHTVLWSGSADLLRAGKRLPGQLSLTDQQAVWHPSRYAALHGAEGIQLALPGAQLDLQAGTALLDVIVNITPDGSAGPVVFLTHSSPALRESVRQLRGRT